MLFTYRRQDILLTLQKALKKASFEVENYPKEVLQALNKNKLKTYEICFTGSRLVVIPVDVDPEKEYCVLPLSDPAIYQLFINKDFAALKKQLAEKLVARVDATSDAIQQCEETVWNNMELAPTFARYLLESKQVPKLLKQLGKKVLSTDIMVLLSDILEQVTRLPLSKTDDRLLTDALSALSQQSFERVFEQNHDCPGWEALFSNEEFMQVYTGFVHLSQIEEISDWKQAKILIVNKNDFDDVFDLSSKELSQLVGTHPVVAVSQFKSFVKDLAKNPVRVVSLKDALVKDAYTKTAQGYVANVDLANRLVLEHAQFNNILRGRVPQISTKVPAFGSLRELIEYSRHNSVLRELLTTDHITFALKRNFMSIFPETAKIDVQSAPGTDTQVLWRKAIQKHAVGYSYYARRVYMNSSYISFTTYADQTLIQDQLEELGVDPRVLTKIPIGIQALLETKKTEN